MTLSLWDAADKCVNLLQTNMTRNILGISGAFMGALSLKSSRNLLALSLLGCQYPAQGLCVCGGGVEGGADVCWLRLRIRSVADSTLTATEQSLNTSEPRRFVRLQV